MKLTSRMRIVSENLRHILCPMKFLTHFVTLKKGAMGIRALARSDSNANRDTGEYQRRNQIRHAGSCVTHASLCSKFTSDRYISRRVNSNVHFKYLRRMLDLDVPSCTVKWLCISTNCTIGKILHSLDHVAGKQATPTLRG